MSLMNAQVLVGFGAETGFVVIAEVQVVVVHWISQAALN